MAQLRSEFTLEIFDQRRAQSTRLAEFLAIYVEHFSPQHRTKTNELVHTLENPRKGQTLVFFGLSYRSTPCGFATFMFYREHQIGVFDFLTIAATARGYGAFFTFCDLIAGYLEKKAFVFDYAVAEVTLRSTPISSGIDPAMLVRLLRLVGFRAAAIPYYAPDPSITNSLASCRSVLMLYSQPDRTVIESAELLRIIRMVYWVHYFEWFESFMRKDELDRYRKVLASVSKELANSLPPKQSIRLNGLKDFELPFRLESATSRIRLVAYIGFLCIPAALTVAAAIATATTLSIVVSGIVVVAILISALHPRLRDILRSFFGLRE